MPRYCVNMRAQDNGDHEVHDLDRCTQLPKHENRMDLGTHTGCQSAVQQAKRTYPRANGCAWCSPACHTS